MYSRISLFVLTISILALSACKSDCTESGTCDPQHVDYKLGIYADYISFKTGSYWIYKHSVTGQYDTVTCLSSQISQQSVKGNTNSNSHITINFEKLKATYFSSFSKWMYTEETVSPTVTSNTLESSYKIMLSRSVKYEGDNISFIAPFAVNSCAGKGGSVTCCANVDTTLKVNSSDFTQVVKYTNTSDEVWNPNSYPIAKRDPKAIYWWSKGIGLIKRTNLTENYDWDLVEYHLVP